MTKIGEPRLAALGAIGVAAVGPSIAPAVLVVSAGIAALLGARAWRLALAALPPAPPSGGLAEPVPTLPVPAGARPTDPFRRSRQPVGTSSRTWRL